MSEKAKFAALCLAMVHETMPKDHQGITHEAVSIYFCNRKDLAEIAFIWNHLPHINKEFFDQFSRFPAWKILAKVKEANYIPRSIRKEMIRVLQASLQA